jgi:hypothetical protein
MARSLAPLKMTGEGGGTPSISPDRTLVSSRRAQLPGAENPGVLGSSD